MGANKYGWRKRRRELKETAGSLSEEFSRRGIVRYLVKARLAMRLELLVWPESGLDNFEERIGSRADLDRVSNEFRRIVALYEEGQRPPFRA